MQGLDVKALSDQDMVGVGGGGGHTNPSSPRGKQGTLRGLGQIVLKPS